VFLKYRHKQPAKPQHSPHKHWEIVYGVKDQQAPEEDTSPHLDTTGIKRVQGIVGSFLYYAWAINNKLLVALSTIGMQHMKAMTNTLAAVNQLLDHCNIPFEQNDLPPASNMILAAHSNASFLSELNSGSQAGAHIFLSKDDPIPQHNGPILTIAQLIKFVMALAAKTKLSAMYNTARDMVPLQNTLAEMGWPRPNH